MNIPTLPTDIIGWVAIVSVIAGAYFVVRRSDITSIREAADDLRKRVDDKDKTIKELELSLQGFKEELAKLRGILEEKDKRIDALSKINIGTTPEMLAYMQDGRTFMTQMHNYMMKNNETLTEINQRAKTIK